MERLKVEAIRRHSYGGKVRAPGDQYFMDHPKHVKLYVAIKRVKPIDVEAEEARKKALSEAAKKGVETRKRNQQRGRYQRKDVSKTPENKKVTSGRNGNFTKKS